MSDIVSLALAGVLASLAWSCLIDRRLARACVVFILYSLMMSVTWWLLGARWLALAEALVSALLTAMALLHALGGKSPLPAVDDLLRPRGQALSRGLASICWPVLAGLATWFLLDGSGMLSVRDLHRQPLLPAGLVIMTLGLWAFGGHAHLLRRLLAFNILGSGIFLILAALTGLRDKAQVLIVTGLLVALAGSVLGAILIRRLYASECRLSLALVRDGDP
jgi:uncharacterized MnhB-related membrane protein